jgi:transcription antitermination factor NusG
MSGMGLRVAEPCLPADFAGPNEQPERLWLAAYTKSRHEEAVARGLGAKYVEFLLPTFWKRSQWSDRVHRVAAPLFPGYVFVNVSQEERVRVLQTAGVVSIVAVAGKPSPLRDEEVSMLRECAARPREVEPFPFLQSGQRVRVAQGPFAGWEGVLAYRKNCRRLVVTIERIMQSISVNLDGADVEPLNQRA